MNVDFRSTNDQLIHFCCISLRSIRLAARQYIPPGCLEIAGVPRIGDIAGVAREVHQEVHFVSKVAAADTVHIPQIGFVHPNQQKVFFVIAVGELPCGVTAARDPILGQLTSCRQIDRIANLPPAGSC